MSPGELIKSIDELNSPNAYSPYKLSGLNLEYSEMKSGDYSIVVDAFYSQFADHRKVTFENALRNWMSEPIKYHILTVKSDCTPICLIVYTIESQIENVHSILINSKTLKPTLHNTFIKRMAFKLLDDAHKEQIERIDVKKRELSKDVIDALKECRYIDNLDMLQRFIKMDILAPDELTTIPLLPKSSILNHAIDKYVSSSKTGAITSQATIELEKSLWPLKITDSNVPCFIVPIQANYAKELFDENLANTNISLFSNEKLEPALSIENVYFKSRRNIISKYPARILWYVSIDPGMMETGMIRACSYLDSVEISDSKTLYKKYRRLGVLEWQEMQRISKGNDNIAAYRFSYTELFDNPVSLENTRNIIKINATFQSFMEIKPEMFLKIYTLGNKG